MTWGDPHIKREECLSYLLGLEIAFLVLIKVFSLEIKSPSERLSGTV